MVHVQSNLTSQQANEVISILGLNEYRSSIWRLIPSYSNYCVNSKGTYIIRLEYVDSNNHVQRTKIMKFYELEYLVWQHGFVHTAVGEAFLSDFEPYPQKVVNHLDGNKRNNDISNLEICTPQENTHHFWTADCFEEARRLHGQRLSASLRGRPSCNKGKKLGPDTSGNTHNKGTICVHKDGLNKLIFPNELESYLAEGWIKGQIQHHVITDELRAKFSECHKGRESSMKGKHLTDATKEKISQAVKLYASSEEVRKQLSNRIKGEKNPFYGKHHTEATKKHLSELHKGHKQSDEVRQHLSKVLSGQNNPMYGHKHTEESKQKMREALKGRASCNKSKIWITNGIDNKMIFESELSSYPSYYKGVTRPKVDTVWINNGIESKRIAKTDLNNYPGYSVGRIYKRTK